MSVDLLQIIQNIQAILPSGLVLARIISLLIGLVMVITAIRLAMNIQSMGRHAGSWSQVTTTFLVGISFAALPLLINILATTLTGSTPLAASAILAQAPVTVGSFGSDPAAKTMIVGITAIVMMVGVIGVMRGLLLLNAAAKGGQGSSTFGPGLTFVIAGAVATNFPFFVGIAERFITTNPGG